MLKTLLLGVILMTGLSTTLEASATNGRILMVVRDDSRYQDLMLEKEVFVMQNILNEAGYEIDVVTVNDEPLTGCAPSKHKGPKGLIY